MSRKATPLLVAFLDFSGFKEQMDRVSDAEAADTMDDFYQLAASAIGKAGGRTVKFIGDAVLVVFPADKVDAGVSALLELKRDADRFMSERDWQCALNAKVHFGEVMAGEFGPKGDKRFDVIGHAVNATAMMPHPTGIKLSDEALAKASPALRQQLGQ